MRSSVRRATRPENFAGHRQGQPPLPAAVGIHDVNRRSSSDPAVGRRWPRRRSVGHGRPAHPGKAGWPASLPTPVGVHDPESAGIAAAGRLADEGDLRRSPLAAEGSTVRRAPGTLSGTARCVRGERRARLRRARRGSRSAAFRRRRRPRCLASSISASTRASNSPCVTGSLGRGGRGGAVTVTTSSVVRLS